MSQKTGTPRSLVRRRRGERGLSLLEVLIAMALLAVIAVGILPMMMRSIADSNRGWEATEVSNFAQSEIEPMLAAPFESSALALAGTLTEKIVPQSWVEGDEDKVNDALEGWTAAPTSTDRVFWSRNTFIRWYGVDDLNTPLPGDTESTEVSLKEIQVQLVGERQGGALGAGQELWVRVLKAY